MIYLQILDQKYIEITKYGVKITEIFIRHL